MWGMMLPRPAATRPLASVAVLALVAAALLTGEQSPAVALPVAMAVPARNRRRGLVLLVGWILAGAVAGGALGWAISQAAAPGAALIATIFGAAIGGGFAAVVRLFVFTDSAPQQPESVTIERNEDDAVPDPQPIDLFEGSPDPILYFDDAGEGPVVRAANPAYEDVFGVTTESVENAALGDALLVSENGDAIVAAAGGDEAFDGVVACETGETSVTFRIRTTTIESGTGTRGYVLYTPVEAGD